MTSKFKLCGSWILLVWALIGIWIASGVVFPRAESLLVESTFPEMPGVIQFGLSVYSTSFQCIHPVAGFGLAVLIVALIGKGPKQLVRFCREAFPVFCILIACFSIYLGMVAGVASVLAADDLRVKASFQRRTLEQFALLEAAENRYEKVREALNHRSLLRVVEVGSVSDFDNVEARERIRLLVSALSQTTEIHMQRRILASLVLFRDRIPDDVSYLRDLPETAEKAGAPSLDSQAEVLDWLADNINHDGWEPIPLFKLEEK